MTQRGEREQRRKTSQTGKISWTSISRFNRLSMGLIAVAIIGAVFAYAVTRPTRIDLCASEVLTNGGGVSVNLAAKTLKLETQERAVPLERLSNQSAMVIDTLSRLCREREKGNLSEEEYRNRFNQVVQPVLASAKLAASANLPIFKDDVCMTAYCSNGTFIKFLGYHDGNVVRIKSMFDFSSNVPTPFEERCITETERDKEGGYPPDRNPFNKELPLPEWGIGKAPPGKDACGSYFLVIRSKAEPVWSSGGTGTLEYQIDGFFRVRTQLAGTYVTFYLDEVPATASDFG